MIYQGKNKEISSCFIWDKNNQPREKRLADHCNEKRKWIIVWKNVIGLAILHIGALYGIYLSVVSVMWKTTVFWYLFSYVCAMCGITAGAHRLWAHRSYKARWPLRMLLVLFNCVTLQGPIINWVRDHRMHHRFAETDADPHNSSRGLFFSHIGWLLVKKHPQIKAEGHKIDLSDVLSDSVLLFQKRYYLAMAVLLNTVPVYIPTLWEESVWNAFFTCFVLRHTVSLHFTWLVNSAAHKWGNRPYDKTIAPTENKIVSWLAIGEGFHNYHHAFPWDYKTAELGNYSLNSTKLFIDVMAYIGWAYDLKTAPKQVIQERIKRTGDE